MRRSKRSALSLARGIALGFGVAALITGISTPAALALSVVATPVAALESTETAPENTVPASELTERYDSEAVLAGVNELDGDPVALIAHPEIQEFDTENADVEQGVSCRVSDRSRFPCPWPKPGQPTIAVPETLLTADPAVVTDQLRQLMAEQGVECATESDTEASSCAEEFVAEASEEIARLAPVVAALNEFDWEDRDANSDEVTGFHRHDSVGVINFGPPAPGCDVMYYPGIGQYPYGAGRVCTPIRWVSEPDEPEFTAGPNAGSPISADDFIIGGSPETVFPVSGMNPSFDSPKTICTVAAMDADDEATDDAFAFACSDSPQPVNSQAIFEDDVANAGAVSEELEARESSRIQEQREYTAILESGESHVWETCWLSHREEVAGSSAHCTDDAAEEVSATARSVQRASAPATVGMGAAPANGTVEVRHADGTVLATAPVTAGQSAIETAGFGVGEHQVEFLFHSDDAQVPDSTFAVNLLVTEPEVQSGGGEVLQISLAVLFGLAVLAVGVMLFVHPRRP